MSSIRKRLCWLQSVILLHEGVLGFIRPQADYSDWLHPRLFCPGSQSAFERQAYTKPTFQYSSERNFKLFSRDNVFKSIRRVLVENRELKLLKRLI